MTTITPTQILLNRNNKDKVQDNFHVSFYNMEGNISNYLGKQVKTISRPNITIEDIMDTYKGNTHRSPGRLVFDPINIEFSDDEDSLTSMILYAQIMRQRERYAGEVEDIMKGDESHFKFGIKLQLFNSRDEETECYIFKDCFINGLTNTEQVFAGNDSNSINVSVLFDNINIKVFDRFIEIFT